MACILFLDDGQHLSVKIYWLLIALNVIKIRLLHHVTIGQSKKGGKNDSRFD